jgi:SAM-dependent methyltransferase
MDLLNGVDFEINRLTEQAKCWEPEAEILFDRIPVQSGWKCIDLGCGPLGVLGELSHRVGIHGQVTGFDHNPYCIHAAEEFIDQNHLKNVNVIEGDLFNNSLKPHSFDLCHMRFVFTQIGCSLELVKEMAELTRPGGVVISEESDWASWNCFPFQPAWEQLKRSMIEVFEIMGGDLNAGLKSCHLFNKAQLLDIQIRTAMLDMPIGHPYRSGLVRFALSLSEKILGANILSENEFSSCIKECNEIINDPAIKISSYTLYQVWGWVKAS